MNLHRQKEQIRVTPKVPKPKSIKTQQIQTPILHETQDANLELNTEEDRNLDSFYKLKDKEKLYNQLSKSKLKSLGKSKQVASSLVDFERKKLESSSNATYANESETVEPNTKESWIKTKEELDQMNFNHNFLKYKRNAEREAKLERLKLLAASTNE